VGPALGQVTMPTIYQITSPSGANYIGSTKLKFAKRQSLHLSQYRLKKGRLTTASILFDEAGPEACVWSILEECDEAVRYEREKFWIQSITCVNKLIPGRTAEEKKELEMAWRIEHAEDIKVRSHELYLLKREERIAKQKAYYEANREERKAYARAYSAKKAATLSSPSESDST
jgi:hypothetical protein